MKVAGIIAEYNPLHNGHLYQLSQIDADVKIAVMSGNFVQRGAPAIWDKWTRAKFAVMHGVDLVLELPVDFAVASAERFAFGGVYILNALQFVDTLCFGAESPLPELQKAAAFLSGKSFEDFLQKGVLEKLPYHIARNLVVEDTALIQKPNNILAIEYLKALKKLHSNIHVQVVLREGAAHDANETAGKFASASYLRKALLENTDCSSFMPYPLPETRHVSAQDIYPFLRYRILNGNLSDIAEIREGIENRIYQKALHAFSFDTLVSEVKTKRYTYSAICRMLVQCFLDMRKKDLSPAPQYTRLLAANEKGRMLLKELRSNAQIPIITKGADHPVCTEFDLDVRAGNLYALIKNRTSLNLDYTHKPFILSEHPDKKNMYDPDAL